MPGTPKECRDNADCCRRLAETATGVTARETFLNLADTWDRLACELENAQAFLEAMEEIEPPKPFGGRERKRAVPRLNS
jgi:hypothetical protein